MEKVKGSLMDQRALMMKELAQGIELAKQLRTQMLINSSGGNRSCSRDDQALNSSLVQKLLYSFDKSISLAKLFNSNELHYNSPQSLANSRPSNESSSRDLRVSKKREKLPSKIQWIRLNKPGGSVPVLEGCLDDGFTWRKYGQKDILGAKFPRGYYRCTHRYSQSCGATKQVQKSDEDPCLYQVIYKGEHTCNTTRAHSTQALKKPNSTQLKTQPQLSIPQQPPQSNQQEPTLGLDPKFEHTEKEDEAQIFNSSSFESAQFGQGLIDDYMLSSSPGFWSPPTSESNYFPVSITNLGAALYVQTSESNLNESMSGPSSVNNSPNIGHFEFPLDPLPDIDADFSFDFLV